MNSTRIWLLFVLLFCLAALGYAQQSGPQSDPNHQEETRHPPDVSPPPRSPEVKPPRQEQPQQQEEKPPKAERQATPKPPKEQAKPNREESDQAGRQGKVKVSGKSARIPDSQLKADFGRQHPFIVNRVITQTTIVPQQTQFVFAGYTFVFLDPWPREWLLTDDCYIDIVDDEYFLFDAFHPGIRVALFVVG